MFARFGLMHMMATNICVWLRTIIMETIRDVEIHARSSDGTSNGLDVLSHMFGHNNGTSRTTSTTTTTTASPQSHEYHVYGEHMNKTGMYSLLKKCPGFPPIREIRENFENFFQSGKSGKNRVFSPNQRKKFEIRELFFKTIFKPFKPLNQRENPF